MTIIEQRAWFVLIVSLLAVVAVFTIFGFTQSWGRASGGLGILGLTAVVPFIGFRRKRRGEVVVDERDRAVLQSAGRIAIGTCWIAAVSAVVVAIANAGDESTIRVSTVAWALWLAWLLINVVHSCSVLWISKGHRER